MQIGEIIDITLLGEEYHLIALAPSPFNEAIYGAKMSQAGRHTQKFDELVKSEDADPKEIESLALEAEKIVNSASIELLKKIVKGGDDEAFLEAVEEYDIAPAVLTELTEELKKRKEKALGSQSLPSEG